jgi:hypothetical protein
MKSRVEARFDPEPQPIKYPYVAESNMAQTIGMVVLVTGPDAGVVLVPPQDQKKPRYYLGYVFSCLDENTLTRIDGSIVVKFTNE